MQFGVVYEDGNVTGMYKDILDENIDVIAEVLTVDNLNIKVIFLQTHVFQSHSCEDFLSFFTFLLCFYRPPNPCTGCSLPLLLQ